MILLQLLQMILLQLLQMILQPFQTLFDNIADLFLMHHKFLTHMLCCSDWAWTIADASQLVIVISII